MRFFPFSVSLVVGVFVAVPAISQNYSQCLQILEDGKVDIEIVSSDSFHRSFAQKWFCQQSYEEGNSDKAFSLSAVYGEISGDASYSQSAHNEYQNEFCQKSVSELTDVESSHVYRQLVNPQVVDAWQNCIADQNKGLVCDATQPNENEIRFSVAMLPSVNNDLTNGQMLISNLEKVFQDQDLFKGTLTEGSERVYQLTRIDPTSPAFLQVDGTVENGTTVTCDYRIPVIDESFDINYERLNLQQLIAPTPAHYENGAIARTFQTQQTCTVWVTETLTVNRATVNRNLDTVSVSYSCNRPNHRYTCGAGTISPTTDASYSANVTASVSVEDGMLSVESVSDGGANAERACGNIVSEYLSSLDGTSLDTQ